MKNAKVKLRTACGILLSAVCLLACLPISAAAQQETHTDSKTVRVGWYEDSYHITGENGERSGYGYEYEQAIAAYTGWNYEYVQGSWSQLLEMLQNGEIDLMGALSYTDERAETMLFSDMRMGEEKYYLYADLTDPEISPSDLSTLNGKRIVVMEDSVQAVQFSEWEERQGIKTQHINIDNMERAMEAAKKHEIDGVISTETPIWVEFGMSAIAMTGGSGIYYGISQTRPDLKEALDNAMRKMEADQPFYADELYQRYLSAASTPVLSSEEKEWLGQHGQIKIGWLKHDGGFSCLDEKSGKFTGVLADYIQLAADCLGKEALQFYLVGYDSLDEEVKALQNGEIDMIFHAGQNPYVAEQNGLVLSNTFLSLNMAAVTAQNYFDENAENRVAVPKEKPLLKWYISYNYPSWEILEYDSEKQAESAVLQGKADCLVTDSDQLAKYLDSLRLHSVFLTKPGNTAFAVRRGSTVLISILNKTLKAMPSSTLLGALATYETAGQKVTAMDFIKDNLLTVSAMVGCVFIIILALGLAYLQQVKRARTVAENSAAKLSELNAKLQDSHQELQAALTKAESANAAKTTFLNNMSHDVRTPMNAILGFTALAEKDAQNPAALQDHLRKIQMSGKSMLSILDNVLELSRIESGKATLEMTPLAAGSVFDACLVMEKQEIEKRRQTIQVKTELKEPYIYFDAPRITEIILNLLSNAIKYTPDGGTIQYELTQSPHDEKGWVWQQIVVADNGIGMSEEFQTRIFDWFERERSTTASGIQGTGLGMGIVKKLVDLMNGTIEVRSKQNEGTRITVRIPCRIATYEETQPRHTSPELARQKLAGKRILLAEDNDLNAEIAIALLEDVGLQADRAKNGVECVTMLDQKPAGYYQLILMDVQMPVLDGYQATEKIRAFADQAKAKIPIIALTANAFSEDKQRALQAGMNDHAAKPMDMNKLTDTLLQYIGD